MKLQLEVEKRQGAFSLQLACCLNQPRSGLFGPSGSGKSSLLQLLAGLRRPDHGHICLNDRVLFDSAAGIDLSPQQRRIGLVFQQGLLFPHLSARRNLLYGYHRTPPRRRQLEVRQLVDLLQLGPLLDRSVRQLSGGERQRLALGRSLLACPDLLLLDEPLSGLDDTLKYQILPCLQQLFGRIGVPVLLTSHVLGEMRLLTDEVVELRQGRLHSQGPVDALARRQLGSHPDGYLNLLSLERLDSHRGLYRYRWGRHHFSLLAGSAAPAALFGLSSKDITLFKRHPEASSARNLLAGRVERLFEVDNRVGVELDCDGQRLIAQVVNDAVAELHLRPGQQLTAAIKASAFRRLHDLIAATDDTNWPA